MRRTLETIFRRLWGFIALIVILPLIGLGIAFLLPRTYESSATIWALHRYTAIGSTGPESNLEATPAETQSNALKELLHTRLFALNVSRSTGLAEEIRNSPGYKLNGLFRTMDIEDAMATEVADNVIVTPNGYNLLQISYTNSNPRVAQEIVKNVIAQFGGQSSSLALYDGQKLLDAYQSELAKAKDDYDKAVTAEVSYLQKHPDLARSQQITDPEYARLHAKTQQAQTSYQNIQNSIDNLRQQLATLGQGSSDLFKVVDETSPGLPTSRMKSFLLCAGTGLGIALAACALYIVIMVRRDRAVYTASDIQKITSLPVIMQTPHLTAGTTALLTNQTLPPV